MKVYNTLSLPILLHGDEIWTLREKIEKRFTSIEIKFLSRAAGYTLFWPENKLGNCGTGESRTRWLETKKIQIKLAKIFNKNKQQYAKNNDEI
jgi:hypothetical protein